LLLGEIVATNNEGEEGTLVIGDGAVALQLNEFTQQVAPEWRPEALVDERDVLGTELLLSSRGRMTLVVGEIF
jgi:hypothetical protein